MVYVYFNKLVKVWVARHYDKHTERVVLYTDPKLDNVIEKAITHIYQTTPETAHLFLSDH